MKNLKTQSYFKIGGRVYCFGITGRIKIDGGWRFAYAVKWN